MNPFPIYRGFRPADVQPDGSHEFAAPAFAGLPPWLVSILPAGPDSLRFSVAFISGDGAESSPHFDLTLADCGQPEPIFAALVSLVTVFDLAAYRVAGAFSRADLEDLRLECGGLTVGEGAARLHDYCDADAAVVDGLRPIPANVPVLFAPVRAFVLARAFEVLR